VSRRRSERRAAERTARKAAKHAYPGLPTDVSPDIRRGLEELYDFLERTGRPPLDLSSIVAVAYGGAPSGELEGMRGIDVLPESVGVVGDDFIIRLWHRGTFFGMLQGKGEVEAEVVEKLRAIAPDQLAVLALDEAGAWRVCSVRWLDLNAPGGSA
jgi:hypothetical protein